MGIAQEERRDGALKEGKANRFRCRHEHMIGQFTMIGYCYFLLSFIVPYKTTAYKREL